MIPITLAITMTIAININITKKKGGLYQHYKKGSPQTEPPFELHVTLTMTYNWISQSVVLHHTHYNDHHSNCPCINNNK